MKDGRKGKQRRRKRYMSQTKHVPLGIGPAGTLAAPGYRQDAGIPLVADRSPGSCPGGWEGPAEGTHVRLGGSQSWGTLVGCILAAYPGSHGTGPPGTPDTL